MEQWKKCKIRDIVEVNAAQYTSKDNWEKALYLDTGNITENKIDEMQEFDCSSLPSRARRKVKHGDIIFSTVRPNQKHYGYITNPVPNLLVSTGFAVISVNQELANSKFIYYWLSQDEIVEYLHNIAEQSVSAYPSIKASDICNLEIKLPPLEYQSKVASILSTLENKISLNHRINRNLEQQAQALFKAWFVDFEPFKNEKFVDSELGRIPEGWNIVEANHFMKISKDSINPTKNPMCLYTHYSIPAFDKALTPEIQYGYEIKSNKFLVHSGMTLFSKLNPRIKRIWFIDEVSNNSVCSTEFIPYESLGLNYYFLYCYLNSNMFYNQAMSLVNGATGSHQRFHPNETLKFLFVYKKEIIEEFNVLIAPILKEMSKLSLETRKLTKLRDTLLPRLMSGELKIDNLNR